MLTLPECSEPVSPGRDREARFHPPFGDVGAVASSTSRKRRPTLRPRRVGRLDSQRQLGRDRAAVVAPHREGRPPVHRHADDRDQDLAPFFIP